MAHELRSRHALKARHCLSHEGSSILAPETQQLVKDHCRQAVRNQISQGAEVVKFAATGGVNSDVAGGLARLDVAKVKMPVEHFELRVSPLDFVEVVNAVFNIRYNCRIEYRFFAPCFLHRCDSWFQIFFSYSNRVHNNYLAFQRIQLCCKFPSCLH